MMILIQNKKARYEYAILDKYIAGIQLTGIEVKSIKASKVSIAEAYCYINDNEVFILGMNVSEYKGIKNTEHVAVRDRKLLLNKKEIQKLSKSIKEKGLTLIPLTVMVSDKGLIKIEIALAKGKNTVDKRESIKQRDIKKELKKIKP